MNYNSLLGNHSTSINISLLKGQMLGKRVVVIDKPSIFPLNRLKSFFDIIIAEEGCGDLAGSPDIYISNRRDAHINGIFDLAELAKYSGTLYVLDFNLINSITKANKRHRCHSLQAHLGDVEVREVPALLNSIPYGLSEVHPGHHLALIGGARAEDIYSEYRLGTAYESEISKLMTTREGLKPRFILNPNRNQFLFNFKVLDV